MIPTGSARREGTRVPGAVSPENFYKSGTSTALIKNLVWYPSLALGGDTGQLMQ